MKLTFLILYFSFFILPVLITIIFLLIVCKLQVVFECLFKNNLYLCLAFQMDMQAYWRKRIFALS